MLDPVEDRALARAPGPFEADHHPARPVAIVGQERAGETVDESIEAEPVPSSERSIGRSSAPGWFLSSFSLFAVTKAQLLVAPAVRPVTMYLRTA
ncbi:MAG: hypothetical protein RMJ04_08025 [Geminicoccaceae bacterium]|nr:hypothetical protein [Geminicoccaceae bacterium]